jgi:hypothetical protein
MVTIVSSATYILRSTPTTCSSWNFLNIHCSHDLYFFDTIKKTEMSGHDFFSWKSSQLMHGKYEKTQCQNLRA